MFNNKNKMMKKVKRLFLTALLLLGATAVGAQESDWETSVSANIVNQYIWRGQDLGNVSLQPTFGVGYKGLSLTAWGSVGLTEANDTKEFDLTLGYTFGGFNIGVTDYWFNKGLDPQNRYFKYNAHGTNHVFEGNIGYDFGLASVQWYTNFAGNDGVNGDGKRAYSSYFELNVPFRLGGIEWTATAGAVPTATTLYGTTGFAVTLAALKATKDIHVTPSFSLPVFAGIAANPCSQKAYLLFGVTLRP